MLAKPVLRHRLVLSFTAESEGVTADDVIDRILPLTPTREDEPCAMPDSKRFLHPEAIQRIAARSSRPADRRRVLGGMHRSPSSVNRSSSASTANTLGATTCADVDWKVWAKQDRFYVKQYEEDTNLRAMLLVDVSHSMRYGSGAMNKYGVRLPRSLHALPISCSSQQDAVGGVSFDDSIRMTVPQRTKRNHLDSILGPSTFSGPKNKTDLYQVLRTVAESYPRRGTMVLIPDLLVDRPGLFKGSELSAGPNDDLSIFHVMDDDETRFSLQRPDVFRRTRQDTRGWRATRGPFARAI